jgi:hypothetical protein
MPALIPSIGRPAVVFAITLLVLGLAGIVGGVIIVRRRDDGSATPGVVIVTLGAVAATLAIALITTPGVPA